MSLDYNIYHTNILHQASPGIHVETNFDNYPYILLLKKKKKTSKLTVYLVSNMIDF